MDRVVIYLKSAESDPDTGASVSHLTFEHATHVSVAEGVAIVRYNDGLTTIATMTETIPLHNIRRIHAEPTS